jgi:sulfur-oxidizing protein SoxX
MARSPARPSGERMARRALFAAGLLAVAVTAARADDLAHYAVVGDAIPAPLTADPGDPARGRAIVVDRRKGLCLLCHQGPFPEERFQGDLAPDLAGVGDRHSAGRLRLRLVDSRRLNGATIMPSYYRTDGLRNVGPAWADKPILTGQEIEDVVAFLATLKGERTIAP